MAKKIRIVSKVDGFRRCGVGHSTEATLHDLDRFTKEELKTLKADPNLLVDEVDENAKADAKGSTDVSAKKVADAEKRAMDAEAKIADVEKRATVAEAKLKTTEKKLAEALKK